MNADPLELQKFSELAHRWWDPTSEFRPLHEINPLRLEWINALAPLAGKRVVVVDGSYARVAAIALNTNAPVILRAEASDYPSAKGVPVFGSTQKVAAEKAIGRIPFEQHHNNPGFDVLSEDPVTGISYFIEVKGHRPATADIKAWVYGCCGLR